jgi:hypothetical protein
LGELRYYPPGEAYFGGEDVNKDGVIELQRFKPLQLSDISIEDFKKGRANIDTESWINALVSTIGLNYNNYDLRKKLIILSRMIPLSYFPWLIGILLAYAWSIQVAKNAYIRKFGTWL